METDNTTVISMTHKANPQAVYINKIESTTASSISALISPLNDQEHFSEICSSKKYINPMYLIECARQLETLASHKILKINSNTRFILKSWRLELYQEKPQNHTLIASLRILDTHLSHTKKFIVNFRSGERTIGKVSIIVCHISARAYETIRGENISKSVKYGGFELHTAYGLPQVEPYEVGCKYPKDVCIRNIRKTGHTRAANIVIPSQNRILNDHKQDHITGYNLTESAKQFCLYCTIKESKKKIENIYIKRIFAKFYKYAENNQELLVRLIRKDSSNDTTRCIIEILQEGIRLSIFFIYINEVECNE